MALLALGLLGTAVLELGSGPGLEHKPNSSAKIVKADKPQVVENYGKLPLAFEANQGQTDSRVDFLSRGSGYTLFLTPTEAVLSLSSPQSSQRAQRKSTNFFSASSAPSAVNDPNLQSAVVRMKLVGANPSPQVSGLEGLPGKSNYFLGNDPDKWRTNVPHYAKVQYEDVYPGVDLVYYGNQRQLEYDLVVGPGADPDAITLSFEGVERLRIDAQGDLLLETPDGEIRQHKPLVYQEVDGVRRQIAGFYVLHGGHQVGFEVAAYDAGQPLIIDPMLVYSTYLGGNSFDSGRSIAVGGSGNAYVTGQTFSTNFPTASPIQASNAGGASDTFVTKLNAAGSALVYSTYLGGTALDTARWIAVDSSGNAYVTGRTDSTDFPTASPIQATSGGGSSDAFVAKLNPAGSALVYSTYLGGGSFDTSNDIAVDSSGNAYVIGETDSTDFPTADPVQAARGGFREAFVTKLNAAGSALVYSSYLGGSFDDEGKGIAVDASGNAYVTGRTDSTDFPKVNPFMDYIGGDTDAFVSKIGVPPPPPPVCTYSISPTSASFPASGGTGSVFVATRCGWTARSDVSWITITSGTSGGGSGTVEYAVEANPDTGSRIGTLTVTGGQILTVTQAGTALAGALAVTPLELSFSGVVGDAPASQNLQIGSDGGPVNWTATVTLLNGSDWLTISPTSGIASFELPATVTVEVNFAALGAAGLFQAVITVTDPESEVSFEIPVAVVVSAPGGRLLIDPSVIVFTAASTATSSLSQTLRVINQGEGSLQWSISPTEGNLPSWLSFSSSTGTAGPGASQASQTILTADPEGLGSGVNQVLLQVSAPGSSNTPQLLAVTLHVVPAATPASADISPNWLLFLAEPGGALPAEQELTLSNGGGGSLTAEYAASTESGGDWLMVSPSSGTASGDGPFTTQVSVNQAGLAAGVYQGTITATFSSGPPQEVEVLLIVASQAGALRTQAAGLPRAAQCAPSGLQLLATTIGNGLSLPVSFPRVLTALVVDDCGSGVDNATLVASVEGLNIPLRGLGTGFYSGTWVPVSEAAEVTVTFAALHPTFAQVQRSFTVATAAAPGAISLPALFADGVVEGAGFTKRRPLSPGGIVSLFGERFAGENNFASQLPLERELAGVSVRIGGQDAPLYFVGPGQINAQVPFEVSPGDSVPVATSVGGLLTAPQNYLIAPAQPGIFISGENAAILDASFQLVTPQNPVRVGDTIQIFATGLGETDPEVGTGEPAPPFSTVRNPVTVTIGGINATVDFQGLAPGFVGLYQVNAVVPTGVAPGDAVPLVLTQNGIIANPDQPVTIPVQAP